MTFRYFLQMLLTGVLLCAPILIVAQEATEEAPTPIGLTIHVVQRGENLFRIALRYETTVDELVDLNGLLDPTRIEIGQRLLVPSPNSDILPQTHTIQPGETLSTIAQLYSIDVDTLIEQNDIENVNSIYAGQVLSIVSDDSSSSPSDIITITQEPVEIVIGDDSLPTLSSNIHVVQSSETLFRIATRYGLTVQDLASANAITDPTVIYAGQQLIIPNLPDNPAAELDLPTPINALDISPLVFVEGETGVIQVLTSVNTVVNGTFLGRNLAFVAQADNTEHIAYIGIPVFTETDIYTVELILDNADGTQTEFAFNIRVVAGIYGSQNLNVADANLTAPAVQDNELALMTSLTSAITLDRTWTEPFSIPAAAAMNSPYGTRRSYNGGPISAYHSGADFASAPGTPIYAAATGKVVLADTLNIRGNTIVIDHGWGIYTAYAHQSSFNVALGDIVTTGQIIGLAGSTGRVTGPHLHWEVWVNGVPVNPITWTQVVFPS